MPKSLFAKRLALTAFLLIIFTWKNVVSQPSGQFSSGKASFAIKLKDQISPYRVLGVFVLPKETLTLQALDKSEKRRFMLQASSGKTTPLKANNWAWHAPEKAGVYPITINHPQKADSITLNVFVMIPYSRLNGEYLNGYRIGKYPAIPLKQLPIYKPPKGFIEVTKVNQEILVSPHFKLKQFICKQAGGYPKYIALREQLVLKLELILEEVNKKGHRCDSFHVMSGYRTPFYNKAIGNVKYSRHVWGGAADIFIDENPKDGMMDDLNQDGKFDYRDTAVLYDIIDQMYGKPWYEPFIGGLGRYKKTSTHGPFVHIDTRGFRSRWGI